MVSAQKLRLTCAAALLAGSLGCATKKAPASTIASPPAPAVPAAAASVDEFPPGPGRQILMNSCTACHSLREVTKFRGFYVRQQWRDVVMTMVDYGAPVTQKEAEVLTDYLTEQFGKK